MIFTRYEVIKGTLICLSEDACNPAKRLRPLRQRGRAYDVSESTVRRWAAAYGLTDQHGKIQWDRVPSVFRRTPSHGAELLYQA